MAAFILTFELPKRSEFPMFLIHHTTMRTHGCLSPKQRLKILPTLRFGVEGIYHFYYGAEWSHLLWGLIFLLRSNYTAQTAFCYIWKKEICALTKDFWFCIISLKSKNKI